MRSYEVATIAELAAVARGRRKELGLSQAEVADRAGVSRPWVSEFEGGKPKAELHLALRLFDVLGLDITFHARDAEASDMAGEAATVGHPDLAAILEKLQER